MEGLPAGLDLSSADLTPDLRRRQGGHGRGGRQQIEIAQHPVRLGGDGEWVAGLEQQLDQ